MLTIAQLDFNHDHRDKAERFRSLAAELSKSDCFASRPLVEDSAVFSYGRAGRAQLDSAIARIGDRDAIIFLSDICSYSYALVQSAVEIPNMNRVISRYETAQSFFNTPRVRGNCVANEISLAIEPSSVTLVGMMPSPYSSDLVDEETATPNPDIVDVVRESPGDGGSVFAYRLRDVRRYFDGIGYSEWVTYVIPGTVDADWAISQYRAATLTDDLFAAGRAFGTLNDNHQDDYYAVSYFQSIWDLPDDSLAFVA